MWDVEEEEVILVIVGFWTTFSYTRSSFASKMETKGPFALDDNDKLELTMSSNK